MAAFRHRYGRSIVIGVGLLHDATMASTAIDAGAQLIMGSGYDDAIGGLCRTRTVLYVPGVQNAEQVYQALDAHWRVVNFFPAARLGIARLATLVRAFPGASFLAVGGVGAKSPGEYARAGARAVVVRGVIGTGSRWSMRMIIVQMRSLRNAWDAAHASPT